MAAGAHVVELGQVRDLAQVGDAAAVDHGHADVVDELLFDEAVAVVDGVEDLAHRERRRGVLADEPEALLQLGGDRVLEPEEMVGLERLAEARRPRSGSADGGRRGGGEGRDRTPCARARRAGARSSGRRRCSSRSRGAGPSPRARRASRPWPRRRFRTARAPRSGPGSPCSRASGGARPRPWRRRGRRRSRGRRPSRLRARLRRAAGRPAPPSPCPRCPRAPCPPHRSRPS